MSHPMTCDKRDEILVTGLTFVALSRAKSMAGIMIIHKIDYSRVQKLGGKNLQHRLDESAPRYRS